MVGDGKVFTLAQVSEHKTPKDCWLIINGKVFFSLPGRAFPHASCGVDYAIMISPKPKALLRICTYVVELDLGNRFHMFEEHDLFMLVSVSFVQQVYDVTKFLEDHPGGDEVLLSATGKDATDDFEDVGHSDSARDMMDQYYVGEIDISTIPKKTTYKPPNQPHYNQDKTSEFIIKLLQFLVPLAILCLAVGIHHYTKSS
ncbi:hypothetical protein Gotri_017107 [Gossypium trilobum]|uniref:Cytochrome b5 heme-binding domain-containing protein n=1 Tax=Gossypium trilobum TaxID=34281 RepID=A0A7J9E648_9ROSI|nr:hypothetical protein [Gossypium trilobum]